MRGGGGPWAASSRQPGQPMRAPPPRPDLHLPEHLGPRAVRASSPCRPRLQMLASSRAREPRSKVFRSRVSFCPGHQGVFQLGAKGFVFEAESSERETQNKRLRVAFIYLFIYQGMCVLWGAAARSFWQRDIDRLGCGRGVCRGHSGSMRRCLIVLWLLWATTPHRG